MVSIQKAKLVRLSSHEYGQLRHQVLSRDGWRCQSCGARSHLEVHHQVFRSHAGEDCEFNLITLCRRCHQLNHDGPITSA